MRLRRTIVVVTAILAVSAQAHAHEFACRRELGIVQVDEAGRAVLGPDGLPVFTQSPSKALTITAYPTTLGIRLAAINLADEPSVVTHWFDSLNMVVDLQATWYGAPLLGASVPVGATAEAVAVVPIADRGACVALIGLVSVWRMGGQVCGPLEVDGRFVVQHDAGMAECRSRLVCGGEAILRVERQGAGSGTVRSEPAGIACGEACVAKLPAGTTVTLTAIPDAGSRFRRWDAGHCQRLNPCTVQLSSDTVVTAQFEPAPAYTHDLVELSLLGGSVAFADVNASGTVLGTFNPYADPGAGRPFLWHPDTGDVTFIDPGMQASGRALNDVGTALVVDLAGTYWLYDEPGVLRPVPLAASVRPADLGNQGWIVGEIVRDATVSEATLFDGAANTILGPGAAYAVNGSGVIAGASSAGAVLFTRDGGVVDLGFGPDSAAVAVTEGGLVFGGDGVLYSAAWGAGFILDLATGATTIIEPPAPGDTLRVWSANDRREAIVTGSAWVEPMLWSSGRFTPVEDLADVSWWIQSATAINARGQIVVTGWRANAAGVSEEAAAILTPKQ